MRRNRAVARTDYPAGVSSSAAPSPPTEPRGGPRHKVFLPAEMQGLNGLSRVHLLNLSRTGALIHGERAPAPGAIVQLRCAAATWSVRVVWAQPQRFGVVHVTPLAPDTIRALVGA